MSQLPFAERKLLPNPFGRIVGLPLDDDEVDVPEINPAAFETCQRLVEEVRSQRASCSLTLYGDTGSGKTHLLGRVRRWMEKQSEGLFVLVPMDTSPRMLWRHLRRCLADALLRGSVSGRRYIEDLLGGRQAALAQHPERDLAIVLENLLQGTHARDAAAWLRGRELPEAALQRLDLGQPGLDDDQEAVSREMVVSLCSLINPRPVVFCLDQMEALQGFEGETEGLRAAGQALWVLHDRVRNACIISCVQTSFLPVLEKLPEWLQDRMRRSQAIRLLDWEQARSLIAARLNSVPVMADLRRERPDTLWPLPEDPIRQVFKDNSAPARKVISRCKDLFDLWGTGETPPEEVLGDVLQTKFEERITRVEPAAAEAAFRDGLPVLLHSLAASSSVSGNRTFDFVLNGGRQLIALCNQGSGRALEARLKKIGEAWNPSAAQRLLLLRDARLPIGPNAKVTRQRLKSIEEQGGRFVTVSQEAIESLAALRRLLADAQSGDLSDRRGDSISPETVEQWIAGHLPAALDPLMSEIDAPDLLSPKLADLLAQRKIVSLDEAARELGARPEEVESCARRDPRLFGMLGGPAPALFQPVQAEPL